MIDFRIQRSWARDGFDIWLIERRLDLQKGFIAAPIELKMVPMEDGSLLPEPTLQINGPFARELIPAIRSAMAGLSYMDKEEMDISSKVQKAMQAHIEDLRLVVQRTVK